MAAFYWSRRETLHLLWLGGIRMVSVKYWTRHWYSIFVRWEGSGNEGWSQSNTLTDRAVWKCADNQMRKIVGTQRLIISSCRLYLWVIVFSPRTLACALTFLFLANLRDLFQDWGVCLFSAEFSNCKMNWKYTGNSIISLTFACGTAIPVLSTCVMLHWNWFKKE